MRHLFFLLPLLLGLTWAQFPISESFMNGSATGWVISGDAYLTSGNGDPFGQGWLRLTRNINNQKGYAYYDTAFPSTLGLRLEFDFLAWGGSGGNRGADGLTVFLFDGTTPSASFKIGDFGGGLGYCQGYASSPVGGLSNAYVGIAFDEWGNFSNPGDRCPNGGPGQRADSIAIRGPGNGNTGYAYLTGTNSRLGSNTSIDYETAATNRPSPSAYYRRARVDLLPVGGVYQITVYLATSQSGPFTQVLGPYSMPSPPPPTLKIGFAGSTGGSTNYHEIRNLTINTLVAPADLRVVKSGPSTVAPGGNISYTVVVSNVGVNPLTGASFTDTVPAGITGVTWTCVGSGGASCTNASGSGNNIATTLNLPLNSSATFTINGTVSPSAGGQTLTNTASAYPPSNYGDVNPADNTSSVSTLVAGYTLFGRVYHDLQPNSLREPGEDWSSGTLVYVNLVQGGSVVQSVAVSAGTGSYSFSGVAPGSYTLVVTGSASSTTPAPPSGWLFIEPVAGSRSLSVGSSNISGQDFGLYHGSRVSGTVFRDDGLGSGTANDALQNGGEPGIAGVSVTASDGAQSRSAVTDSLGNYVLYVPHTFGSALTLSHPLAPATGSNVGGSSAVLATAYGQSAAQQRTISPFAAGNRYDGYNFGVVRPSLWQPDQSGQASSPGVVTYAHRVRPGTLGTLTFLRLAGSWSYLLRLDANCDGDFADAGEGYQGLPYSLTVGSAWPREADGSLRACAVEVMVIVPAGLPGGSSDLLSLASRLRYAGNPAVDDLLALTDTTVVGVGGELRLTKQVQNLTQGTPPSTGRADGKPGEVLEYCIAYQNQSSAPITQVVLTDPIPFFTDYQPGTLRLGVTPLTDAADADAGEVSGGLVRVRIGTLAAGASGQVCYRVKIR